MHRENDHGVVARGTLVAALACREPEAGRSMTTDTTETTAVTLELDRSKRMLREAFGRCSRNVTTMRDDEYARNLAKRVGSDRVKLPEHMIVLAWDGFRRNAPQDDVEAPGHTYLAIVRAWYAARRRGEHVELPELVREVLEAQGRVTLAEFNLAENSPKSMADAVDVLQRAEIAIEAELEVLRDELQKVA